MPVSSSVQQTLHALADELAAAYPTSGKDGVAPSPFPAFPPPSRAAFRARIAEARDAVERFRPVWSGSGTVSVDDESRIKASGSMREWATNTALLAGLPSLARLTTGPGSLETKTPFALPSNVSLPSLLEARARRLGLEVYRETLLDADDDPSDSGGSSGGAREVLVLGGKALVVELELASPAPDPSEVTGEAGPQREEGLGRWTLVKSSTSISISGAAEPLAVPALDAYLRPPLERLLALAALPADADDDGRPAESDTPELVLARAMAVWERRVTTALASEPVFASRPTVFDEAAYLASLVGAASAGVGAVEDLFPSVRLGRTTVTFEPIPSRPSAAAGDIGQAPSSRPAYRLPSLASSPFIAAPTIPAEPFLWEATFTPPLVVLVCTSSAPSIGNTPSAEASLVGSTRLQTRGYWQPPEGRGRAQRWTLDCQGGGLDQVAFGRVGLGSADEARALVNWARGWTWVLECAEKVLDGTGGPPAPPITPALGELTLESLGSLVADSAIPIALSLPPSVTIPSITLTVPHPSQPIAVQILLSPLAMTSDGPSAGARIALRPVELEERVGRARLDSLGEKLGGEGHAVVLWLMRRFEELEHEGDEPAEDGNRDSKRMRID